MNQMNQIVIEGNVVRDSAVKETPRGTRVCIVPIATNHYYKDYKGELQKETAFLDVEAWGENYANHVVRMATKGRKLRVVGRLKQERWKTADGKSATKCSIFAEHIDFQPQKAEDKSEADSKTDAELAHEGMIAESLEDEGETVF